MFIHNFKYSLKILFRSKSLVFWTLAFPLIMAVLFNAAFSNIENSENFEPIDIAVVKSDDFEKNIIFKESLKFLSDKSSDKRFFDIEYTNLEKAEELLFDEKITGYLVFEGEDVSVTVNSSGINETILRYVSDEIKSIGGLTENIGKERISELIMSGNTDIDYERIFTNISKDIINEKQNIKDISTENMSYVMIEYYSLIAMTCMYSGILSMVLVNFKSANMCAVGKRSAVSPVKKIGMIMGSLVSGYVVQMLCILLMFLFTIFVIGVDYGENLPMTVLLSIVGSLAGLSMGVAVGALVKKGDNAKTTILISITMAGCFLSGMMGITMKNIIDKNVPFLNMINPVAMITDGLYALYYNEQFNRVWFDIISLLIFTVVMMFISWRGLRRQTYDSL